MENKYETVNEIPESIRSQLPEEALNIYMEAYNKRWSNTDMDKEAGEQSRDAVSHRDAWAAVKRQFTHDEERGIWYPKGEEPDQEKDEGIIEKIKNIV